MQKLLVISSIAIGALSSIAHGQFPDTLNLATSSADVTMWGAESYDYMGSWIESGDIDGDGWLDLVVVACGATPLDGAREGEAYILWGATRPDTGTIDLLSDASVSRIFGAPEDDDVFCRSATGDFNNDGFDDILFGHPRYPSYPSEGKTYVVFGQPDFPDTLDLAQSHPNVIRIFGKSWTFGWLGMGLCACDMNGDGYDEVVVAATALPNAEIYVIEGGMTFQSSYDMDLAEPGLTRIIDPELNRATGQSMACADVDGDGYKDLLMGAPGNDIENTYDGRAVLLYGQMTLPDTISLDDPAFRTKRVLPEYTHGQLGWSVAIADVNGDQAADLLVSAYLGDPLGCYDCGEIYVLYSANDLPDSTHVGSLELPITRIIGHGYSSHDGIQIRGADLQCDSFDDIVIANHPWSTEKGWMSIVYSLGVLPDTIFLETDTTRVSRIFAATAGDYLGQGLAIGDFNGTGRLDIAAGAWQGSPPGRTRAGMAYLFWNDGDTSSVGPTLVPPLRVFQNYPNPFSGETTLEFVAKEAGRVTLTVYNVLGQRVAEFRASARAGVRELVRWNGYDSRGDKVASGIYFYRLQTGDFSVTKKLVVLR